MSDPCCCRCLNFLTSDVSGTRGFLDQVDHSLCRFVSVIARPDKIWNQRGSLKTAALRRKFQNRQTRSSISCSVVGPQTRLSRVWYRCRCDAQRLISLVTDSSDELDEKVAKLHLPALGAQLIVLTQEEPDCIGVKVEGPFKNGHFRY